jgi:hypothetical protein
MRWTPRHFVYFLVALFRSYASRFADLPYAPFELEAIATPGNYSAARKLSIFFSSSPRFFFGVLTASMMP